MSQYKLYIESDPTQHVVAGTSPAKALPLLAKMAGLNLVSQNGRYGRVKVDDATTAGVSAMTMPWGRVDYPDARTTRL